MNINQRLELIKCYIVIKSYANNLLLKKLPVGTKRQRGKYWFQKVDSGKWERVKPESGKIDDKEAKEKISEEDKPKYEKAERILTSKDYGNIQSIDRAKDLMKKIKDIQSKPTNDDPDKITSISEEDQKEIKSHQNNLKLLASGIKETADKLNQIGFKVDKLEDMKKIAENIKTNQKEKKENFKQTKEKKFTPEEKNKIQDAEKKLIKFQTMADNAIKEKSEMEKEKGRRLTYDEAKEINDKYLSPKDEKEFRDFNKDYDTIELLKKKYAKNEREMNSLGLRSIWEKHKDKLMKEHGKGKESKELSDQDLKELPKNLKESTPKQNRKVIDHLKDKYPESTLEKRKDIIGYQIDAREKQLEAAGVDYRKSNDQALGNLHHMLKMHETALQEIGQDKLDNQSKRKESVKPKKERKEKQLKSIKQAESEMAKMKPGENIEVYMPKKRNEKTKQWEYEWKPAEFIGSVVATEEGRERRAQIKGSDGIEYNEIAPENIRRRK